MRKYLRCLKRLVCVVRVIRAIWRWLRPPFVAGPLTVLSVKENENMLTYTIGIPAPGASDVVERELMVTRNGETTQLTLALDATEEIVEVEQGFEVELQLVDIDDAGNRSEPSVLSFTATDTVPPPKPADMTINSVTED